MRPRRHLQCPPQCAACARGRVHRSLWQKKTPKITPIIREGSGNPCVLFDEHRRHHCFACAFEHTALRKKRLEEMTTEEKEIEERNLYCPHVVKKPSRNFREVTHYQQNKFGFYKNKSFPEFVYVIRDEDAASILLKIGYLNSKPRNRKELISILQQLPAPIQEHPLNNHGDFVTHYPCIICRQRRALLNDWWNSFCFDCMPADYKSKHLPPPHLQGTEQDKRLTQLIFWLRSKGGTDENWKTPWHLKDEAAKGRILRSSSQRLAICLKHTNLLKGGQKNYIWHT